MASQLVVLKDDQKALVKEIDKNVKNKWNFHWLEEELQMKEFKVKVGDSIDKINVPGKASCRLCHTVVNYGGKGKGTLKEHLNSARHYKRLKVQKSNYNLGSFSGKKDTLFPLFRKAEPPKEKKSSDFQSTPVSPTLLAKSTVPLPDRVATVEAMILSVMAENSMPLTFAPVLVDLERECGKDLKALAQVQLSPASAAYKLKYGLAQTILDSLLVDLRSNPFSLNIDEATSSSNKKILSILVSYYKNDEVHIHHLASIQLLKADAETIYLAICKLFEDNSLPWDNLLSVLFDSCSVMRGSISGVETRIRTEKAPHLLDVDGDSCHHMNNVAKRFCKPFENHLENLFNDLYTDFKWSSDFKSVLQEVCSIMNIPYLAPQMCSSTRWLSCYDRAVETQQLWDALRLFYFSFMKSKCDRDAYLPVMKDMFVKRKLTLSEMKKLLDISKVLSDRKMTKEGEARKHRIISKLFYGNVSTELQLELYASVLVLLKNYICVFQTKCPMVHKLHDLQSDIVCKFFQCFIRPENMTDKVQNVDVTNASHHLPLRHIFIGKPRQTVPQQFLETTVKAYVQAALQMQKSLLKNSTLEALSATDPSFNNHTIVKIHLEKLAHKCKHLFNEVERNEILGEIRTYVNKKDLPSFSEGDRIDRWWSSQRMRTEFPIFTRMVRGLMTIFHGAMVEGTFSIMSRVMCKQTASLSVEMLSAIHTIKYELLSNKLTSLQYFRRNNAITDPVCHELCRNMRISWQIHRNKRQAARLQDERKKKLAQSASSTAAAKKIAALAKKRHFVQHAEVQCPPKKKRKMC